MFTSCEKERLAKETRSNSVIQEQVINTYNTCLLVRKLTKFVDTQTKEEKNSKDDIADWFALRVNSNCLYRRVCQTM